MLAMLCLFILADRVIPRAALSDVHDKVSKKEYLRRYGYVSFPRTLFGILFVLSSGLNYAIEISVDLKTVIEVAIFVIFGVTAAIDAWRVTKIGKIN